jgi:Predicted acyltransferases
MANLKTQVTDRNPSLDSLRGIFAIIVVYSHVSLIRYYFGLSDAILQPMLLHLGRVGVTGFFVLSGYLITVNLLKAKDAEGAVAGKMRSFYLKRILRIWPLYYVMLLLSIYVFPHIDALKFTLPPYVTDARTTPGVYGYYYALLPMVPLSKVIVLPFAEPGWSIGVEEIFYLCIPFLLFFTAFKRNMLLILSLIFILARFSLSTAIAGEFQQYPVTTFVFNLLTYCQFDCILIGCYIGSLFHQGHAWLKKLTLLHFWGAWLLLIVCMGMMQHLSYQYFDFAILFAVIILFAAVNSGTFLNNKVLAFIGKISFSLYMVHELAIVFLHNNSFFAEQIDTYPFLTLNVIIPAATILLAILSYYLIERPFLLIKSRIR